MASQVSQSKPSFSTFNGKGKPSPANDYGRGRSSYQGSQAHYQGSQARSSGEEGNKGNTHIERGKFSVSDIVGVVGADDNEVVRRL
ncbi:uncharacterized protein HKW66_Vig0085180 [Vigna angularis]|uniref:Uncharacterized protein n=1 Tax=Phaseolus angularis TaxID=3914 RepID=A0A8T0KGG0_PHAAN|nr:uncharacterized protein HKW66_Vig0085180 [Vigna angularis]